MNSLKKQQVNNKRTFFDKSMNSKKKSGNLTVSFGNPFFLCTTTTSLLTYVSGYIYRWMKFLLCINSIRDISWSASRRTVFRLNLLEQKLNKSSREGPSSSITITLKSPSDPHHLIVGIPTPPCIIRQNLDSMWS